MFDPIADQCRRPVARRGREQDQWTVERRIELGEKAVALHHLRARQRDVKFGRHDIGWKRKTAGRPV
jgi:hypothetical protein